MASKNPYLEITGPAFFPTVKPRVTATNTEAVWRTRAEEGGWFVKVYVGTGTDDADSANGGLITVDFLADGDTEALGRLENVEGSGDRFAATICQMASDGFAQGGAAADNEITFAQLGSVVQGDANGKLELHDTDGFGKVVGGTTQNLRISWNLVEGIA